MATGTVVITHQTHTTIKKLTFAWTSTAGQLAGDTTTDVITGTLLRVVHIPGATTPTNLYDVVVTDADGIDVLQGMGANVANTGPTDFFPAVTNGTAGNSWGTAVSSKLTLAVTNAGASKTGSTILYYS